MGRPDTLGVDLYHNRQYPRIEDENANSVENRDMFESPQCAIIKCMVDFSRITRTVCLGIYLSASPPQRNVSLAFRIEQDLDSWFDNLPSSIRPTRSFESERSLKRVKDSQWMKRQRLVLSISEPPLSDTEMFLCSNRHRIPQRPNATLCVFPHSSLCPGPLTNLSRQHLPRKYLQMSRIRKTNHRNNL